MTQTLDKTGVDTILAHTRFGVFVLDEQEHVVYLNQAGERLTGLRAVVVLPSSRPWWELLECQDEQGRLWTEELWRRELVGQAQGAPAWRRVRLSGQAAEPHWVDLLCVPLLGESGQRICTIGIIRQPTDGESRPLRISEGERHAAAGSLETESASVGRDQESERSLDDLLADSERQAIRAALRKAHGGRSLAARMLGISRSRLYRRMDALGIEPRSENF